MRSGGSPRENACACRHLVARARDRQRRIAGRACALDRPRGLRHDARGPTDGGPRLRAATQLERTEELPRHGARHARASVLERVYHEGVASERTDSAKHFIEHSPALRAAVEGGNAAAARAAAQALLATGHMTEPRQSRAAVQPFIAVGDPRARAAPGDADGRGRARRSRATSRACGRTAASSPSRAASAEGVVALRSGNATASPARSRSTGSRPLPNEGDADAQRRRLPVHLVPRRRLPLGRAARLPADARSSADRAALRATPQDTLVNTLAASPS